MPELGGLGGRAGGPREKVMINPPTPRSCPQHLTRAAPVAPHDIIKKKSKKQQQKTETGRRCNQASPRCYPLCTPSRLHPRTLICGKGGGGEVVVVAARLRSRALQCSAERDDADPTL